MHDRQALIPLLWRRCPGSRRGWPFLDGSPRNSLPDRASDANLRPFRGHHGAGNRARSSVGRASDFQMGAPVGNFRVRRRQTRGTPAAARQPRAKPPLGEGVETRRRPPTFCLSEQGEGIVQTTNPASTGAAKVEVVRNRQVEGSIPSGPTKSSRPRHSDFPNASVLTGFCPLRASSSEARGGSGDPAFRPHP